MPSHIHLVARRIEGKMSDVIRDFKSFTAKSILREIENADYESRKEWLLHMFEYYSKYEKQNKKYIFWQKTNNPIELYSSSVIDQKIGYVHQNPVKDGIVADETFYNYSSANSF